MKVELAQAASSPAARTQPGSDDTLPPPVLIAQIVASLKGGQAVLDYLECLSMREITSHPLAVLDLPSIKTIKDWDDKVLKYVLANTNSKLTPKEATCLLKSMGVYFNLNSVDSQTLRMYEAGYASYSADSARLEVVADFLDRLIIKSVFPESVYC